MLLGEKEGLIREPPATSQPTLVFIELFEIGRRVIYRTLDTPRCPPADKHGYVYETKCKGKLGDRV